MNIIITLPHELIEEIFIGHKVYETRKRVPEYFNLETDRVFMVEKGTNNVVGFFTIADFITISPSTSNLAKIKGRCCVSFDFLYNYYRHYDRAVFWKIRNYYRFCKPLSLSVMFDKDKAPQGYIYTDRNWGPPNKAVNALSK